MTDASLFEQTQSALQTEEFGITTTELHGFLCGVLSIDISYPIQTSIAVLAPDYENVILSAPVNAQLNEFYEHVKSQMTDPELQLTLMIPENNEIDLSTRVNALAAWCDGYLYGLANAGLQDASQLPQDTLEIIQDLSRIAQLDGADTGEEEEELSYVELMEYVRMAALLVAEELQPIKMTTEIQ
jgi:uncharacterized protein YgfB (UPF0149 family)